MKKFLNIKYFMAAYLGLLLFFSALYYNDLGIFAAGLLMVFFYTVFDLIWTYARDRVWYVPVSSWISALVLSVVAFPKLSFVVLIFLPFLAVVSKQLFRFGKNRHVFNPAASALAMISLITPAVSWWGPVAGQAPIAGFISISAIVILWRQNRWHIALPFLISYGFFLSLFSVANGVVLNRLPHLLLLQIVNGAIIFFSTVMVIEPMTSTFQTRRQEIFFGALIGFMIIVFTYLARRFNLVNLDPLIFGLLSGNFAASLMFLPARKEISTKEKEASFWFRDVPEKRRFPALEGDKDADAAIVGGGIAGISAAYFLSKSGIKTVLLEANSIGSGDSGYTTACATRFLDSLDATLMAWESSNAAITLLRKTITEEKIECRWKDADAVCFLSAGDKTSLERFIDTAKQFQHKDASIEYLSKSEASAAIGVPVEAAYRKKASEGLFHIRMFLKALAERAVKNGALLFEGSKIENIVFGDRVIVKTKNGSITARWLIVAAGRPPEKFFPKVAEVLRHSISYVIDVVFPEKQPLAAGLFWDDSEPYHYCRSVGINEFLLGGEDLKMGGPKPAADPHSRLEKWMKNFAGSSMPLRVVNSWQGSLFSTPDTLPLIGPHPAYGENVIFLTGWAGNGMAQGFFGGNMAADLVLNKGNIYYNIFACARPPTPLN